MDLGHANKLIETPRLRGNLINLWTEQEERDKATDDLEEKLDWFVLLEFRASSYPFSLTWDNVIKQRWWEEEQEPAIKCSVLIDLRHVWPLSGCWSSIFQSPSSSFPWQVRSTSTSEGGDEIKMIIREPDGQTNSQTFRSQTRWTSRNKAEQMQTRESKPMNHGIKVDTGQFHTLHNPC